MKNKDQRYPATPYKHVFWLYILGLHVLLVILILKSNLPEKAANALGLNSFRQQPELGLHYFTMLDYHESRDRLLLPKQNIFIGDSITQGLATSAVIDQSINFGIGGDTTLGTLKRLPNYTSLLQAKTITLAIGLNDLKRRPIETITSNYQQILQTLPKNVPVLISAVLPIDKRVESVTVDNNMILDLNNQLKRLSEQDPRYLYIDARNFLVNETGNLQADMHQGDGVHLSSKGYRVWVSVIQQGLAEQEMNQRLSSH